MRGLFAVLVFASTLLAIGWLGRYQGRSRDDELTPAQRKLQSAERVVYYRMTADEGPRFHLDGRELELRLVTHLVLPPGTRYDPEASYDYGLQFAIIDPDGATIWTRGVYTSTRQSKGELQAGVWVQENAFGLERDIQVSDDRVHRITLPRDLPWGSRLQVRLDAQSGAEGLLRVYERSEDASIGVTLTYFGPSPAHERRLIGRLTYLPWNALSELQRFERLQLRWNRMSAVGEAGRDYTTETIFFSGYRSPPPPPAPPQPVVVREDHATAFTVWGPGLLSLQVEGPCRLERPPSVEFVDVDPSGPGERLRLEPCAAGARGEAFGELWLGDGPHSVHALGLGDGDAIVQAWFDEFEAPPSRAAGFEIGRPVMPETGRSPRIRLSTGAMPVRFALGNLDDFDSRVLRIEARHLVPESDDAPSDAALLYAFFDARGEVIERGRWPLDTAGELDPYERAIDAEGIEWKLSTSSSARLIAPKGSRRLELAAEGDVTVAAFAFWPTSRARARSTPPYDAVLVWGARWEQTPIDHSDWFRIAAEGEAELMAAEQRVQIVGPTRLQPSTRLDAEDAEASPRTGGPWATVSPNGEAHERRTVLEQTKPGDPLARYARLLPQSYVLASRDRDDPRLMYFVEPNALAALGSEVVVTIDEDRHALPLLSTRGVWSLPTSTASEQRLSVEQVPPGVHLYIDQPRIAARRPPAVFKVSTLHRLGPEGLEVEFDKRSRQDDFLNAVVYRCGAARPGTIEVTLDDGAPPRLAGVPLERLTRARRKRVLAERGESHGVVFLDRPSSACAVVARIAVPIGSDIAEGLHRITFVPSRGPELWIRFFRAGRPDEATARSKAFVERSVLLDAAQLTEEGS